MLRVCHVDKDDSDSAGLKEVLIPFGDDSRYPHPPLLVCLLRPIFTIPLDLSS